jgi:hypothetical protein
MQIRHTSCRFQAGSSRFRENYNRQEQVLLPPSFIPFQMQKKLENECGKPTSPPSTDAFADMQSREFVTQPTHCQSMLSSRSSRKLTGNVALTRAAAACSGADSCHRYQIKNQRRVDDKHAVATGTADQAQYNRVIFSTLPFVSHNPTHACCARCKS